MMDDDKIAGILKEGDGDDGDDDDGDGDCDGDGDGGGDVDDEDDEDAEGDEDDEDDGGGDDDGNDEDDDDDLQTILRMHEREEKMKERLMDLRLKSEEQVGVLPYIWTLDNPLLRF